MYNTTKILRGLLEKSTVQVDIGIAHTETKDSKYYLDVKLELNELGYEMDYFFASRPTAESYEMIELTESQEQLISDFLIEAGDTVAQSKGFSSWEEMEAFREKQEYAIPQSIHNLY